MNLEALLNLLTELACTVGLKILYAAAVLLVGWKLIKWLKRKIPQLSFMQQLDAGIRSFPLQRPVHPALRAAVH